VALAALVALAATACGGDATQPGTVDTTSDTGDVVTDEDTAASEDTEEDTAVAADTSDLTDTADPTDTADGQGDADVAPGPLTLSRAHFAPSAQNPLVGTLSVTTDRPALLAVTITGPDGVAMVVPTGDAAAEESQVGVVALWFDATFTVAVQATALDGATAETELSFTTPAAPAYLPRYTLVVGEGAAPAFTLTQPQSAGAGGPRGMLVVIDEQARIRWVHSQDRPIRAARFTSRGTFVVADRTGLTERDLLGRTLWHVAREDLAADTLHHALLELPDGHLLVLSTEVRAIDGYPEDTQGGTSQNVVGDVVIDVAPDGAVAARWSLLDRLDPYRIAHGFFVDGYDTIYEDAMPTRDWSHGNGLAWDPTRQAVLVCLRHQHQIVALDRASGDVLWALGEGGDFALAEPGRWFYGPHAAELTADGRIILFDNGFGRPPADGGGFSRAVELAIDDSGDPASWTAEVAWEWTGATPFYSPAMGDADRVGDEVLVTVSALLAPETQRNGARLVALTHDAEPQILWEVKVDHPQAGYTVFQSDRLGGLYPPEVLSP